MDQPQASSPLLFSHFLAVVLERDASTPTTSSPEAKISKKAIKMTFAHPDNNDQSPFFAPLSEGLEIFCFPDSKMLFENPSSVRSFILPPPFCPFSNIVPKTSTSRD